MLTTQEKWKNANLPYGTMVTYVPSGEFFVKVHSLEDRAVNYYGVKKTSDPGRSALLKIYYR